MNKFTEIHDVLVAARARIADPEHWTQGAGARDSYGKGVEGSSAAAVCWCATSAIGLAAPNEGSYQTYVYATGVLREQIKVLYPSYSIVEFNDDPDRTHAEVLGMFDVAISVVGA